MYPNASIKPGCSRRRFLVSAGSLGAAALAAPASGWAQLSEQTPLRFIVPFGPGSGTDTTARVMGKAITSVSGVPVIVDDRPGANGLIAVQAVLNAPADGRTILLGSNSTLSTNAALFRSLPYDPLTDFAPIGLLNKASCIVVVPAQSPYQTMADLLADARKRPGALNSASGSPSYQLYSAWFNEINKIKTVDIAYKGANEVITAVAGKQVDFAITDAGASMELVRSGRLRALCVTAESRLPMLPDVPTSAEAGVPGYIAFNWVAAAAPAKTPPAVLEQLRTLFRKAGDHPDVKKYYATTPVQLMVSDADTMRRFQTDEIARWKRLAQTAGIKLE